ncbi:MAG: hypothetical protein AB7V46_24870 [Thermomicrobiales bacterium]
MSLSRPSKIPDRPFVAYSSPGRDRVALLYGATIEGVTFLVLAILVTINSSASVHEPGPSISSLPGDKTWPHSDPALVTMAALAVASLLMLPAGIGFLSRSWFWMVICPVMLLILSIVGFILGDWLQNELSVPETTDGWAGLGIMLFSTVTPILCFLPALLGTMLGKIVHGRNARRARQASSVATV